MLLQQVYVPTEDNIIASVQLTDSSPPDFQEEFDDDNDNYDEELIPPTSKEADCCWNTQGIRFM